MVILIDTDTDALQFDQLTQLEGFEYLLQFMWNDQDLGWYMNLGDQDGNQIASGVRLVCGVSLFRKFTDPRLPPGVFTVENFSGTDADIAAPSDLQGNFSLVYITSDDIALTGG
jgi:hypothetical protein